MSRKENLNWLTVLRGPRAGLLAAILMLSLAGCSRPDKFTPLRAQIERHIADKNLPSVAVAVVRGDQIEWEQAFGWADVEKKVSATVHTSYMLGSLSKPITATAAMMLRDQGRLDIDKGVNDVLAPTTLGTTLGDAAAITPRRLMQHTAGLPGYLETFYAGEGPPPSFETLVRLYGSTMVPQDRFHYSNLGFEVLAELITRISGKSFPMFLAETLFAPLGMTDSFAPTEPMRPDKTAKRYFDGKPVGDYITRVVPAADIHSSVHDLALFAMLHMKSGKVGGPLLSGDSIDLMQKSKVPIKGWKYDYALGWSVARDRKGRTHVFHGGGSAGCDAFLTFLPDQKVAVVVLINATHTAHAHLVAQDIAAQVLAAALGDQSASTELELDQEEQRTPLPGELLGSWKGTVNADGMDLPMTLRSTEDGEIFVRIGPGMEQKVDQPHFVTEVLVGNLDYQFKTSAASRRPHKVTLDLRVVNDQLVGILYAYSTTNQGMLLPFPAELRR